MDAGKDIYRISVPVAAGVATAAFLLSEIGNTPWAYILSGATAPLLALCVLTLYSLQHKQRYARYPALSDVHSPDIAVIERLSLCLSMFLLGTLCYSLQQIFSLTSSAEGGIFSGLANAVGARIDSIPYSDAENNALTKAIILGDRSSLSRSTVAAFRTAGAAHLLALSGMHLSIIYVILYRLLSVLGGSPAARKTRSSLIIVLTLFYTFLCGCGASLLRAWFFILLNEAGRMLHRPQPPSHVFCAALTLHLLFRPDMITSVGFQLSYLAMMGIVFVWPYLRALYAGEGLGPKIWSAATLTISCQFFTAPMTLFYFGTFPKHFLITNLVAAPLMSIVMSADLLALLMTALGITAPLIYQLLEFPQSLLLSLLTTISSMP